MSMISMAGFMGGGGLGYVAQLSSHRLSRP